MAPSPRLRDAPAGRDALGGAGPGPRRRAPCRGTRNAGGRCRAGRRRRRGLVAKLQAQWTFRVPGNERGGDLSRRREEAWGPSPPAPARRRAAARPLRASHTQALRPGAQASGPLPLTLLPGWPPRPKCRVPLGFWAEPRGRGETPSPALRLSTPTVGPAWRGLALLEATPGRAPSSQPSLQHGPCLSGTRQGVLFCSLQAPLPPSVERLLRSCGPGLPSPPLRRAPCSPSGHRALFSQSPRPVTQGLLHQGSRIPHFPLTALTRTDVPGPHPGLSPPVSHFSWCQGWPLQARNVSQLPALGLAHSRRYKHGTGAQGREAGRGCVVLGKGLALSRSPHPCGTGYAEALPLNLGGASCLGTCPGLQAPHPATHTCTCQVSWDPERWWLQPLTARSISGRAPKAGPPQDTFQDLTLLPEVCPGDPDGSGHQRPPPPGRDTHPTTAWAQPGSRGGVCASAGAVSREQSQPHPSPMPPPSQGGPPGPLKAKQGPLGVSPRLRAGDKEAAASRVGWGPRPL